MPDQVIPIKLRGREDLFVFGSIERGGPIASLKVYREGTPSYAHLYPGRIVKRYLSVIASGDEVVFGEPLANTEPEPPMVSWTLLLSAAAGLSGQSFGDVDAIYDPWENEDAEAVNG